MMAYDWEAGSYETAELLEAVGIARFYRIPPSVVDSLDYQWVVGMRAYQSYEAASSKGT